MLQCLEELGMLSSHGMRSRCYRFKGYAGSYVVFTGSGVESVRPTDEQENTDKITQQVENRVKNMLIRIEADLDTAEDNIGQKLHLLDTDKDGVISREELQDALKFLQDELTPEEMNQLQNMLGDTEKISVAKLQELLSAAPEPQQVARA
jgi:hypothetical protein